MDGKLSLRELPVGALFRFEGRDSLWVYRGGGFYSSPSGCDGGPWHTQFNPPVVLVEPEERTDT